MRMRIPLYAYYRWLVLFLAAGLCLLPIWAAVIGGFKSSGDLRTNALGLPREWITDNYLSILFAPRFWQMLGNSAFIAIFTVLLTVLVSSMAAFTLAHLRFAGKRWIAGYLTLGLTFPFATAVLPVFIRVRDLGLLDTHWGVILPQVAFNLSFSIVLALVGSWNNFLLPLVTINSDSLYSWPLGIMQFQGQYSTDWGRVLAFVTLTMIPAIAFYLAAQKHIIAGLTAGAVKG